MNTNVKIISNVIDYIDENLSKDLNLDEVANATGYSKYHLHRMFTFVVGLPIHTYIKRRKLTEAARSLVSSDKPIIDIAFDSGYDSQQSFTYGFKKMYKKTPDRYRKKQEFLPIQLKFEVCENIELSGDRAIDVDVIEADEINIVGYCANTAKGFWVIGKSHMMLEKTKGKVSDRIEINNVIGLNDYSNFIKDNESVAFDYYAGVIVSDVKDIPKGMTFKKLPQTKYVVFSFWGDKKASVEPIAKYIYNKWFAQSTYQFNEYAMYDFIKYYDETNESGLNKIEYYVPVK